MSTDQNNVQFEPVSEEEVVNHFNSNEQVYEIDEPQAHEVADEEVVAETTTENSDEKSSEVDTPVAEEKEVKEVIKEVVKEVEKNYSNDTVKMIDRYLKENPDASVEDVMQVLTIDPDKLTEEELITEGWKSENPNITDRLIRLKMEKYDPIFLSKEEQEDLIDEGKLTRNELRDLNVEFENELIKGRTAIQARKDKFDAVLKNTEQTQSPEDDNLAAFQDAVEDYMKGYEKVALNIDGEDYDFELSNEEVAEIKNVMVDPNQFWGRYVVDGKTDFNKLANDFALILNRDRMLKLAKQQGFEKGKLAEIKDQSNIDFDKSKKDASAKSPSIYDAYKKAMGEA